MTLSELLTRANIHPVAVTGDTVIDRISDDSRFVTGGDLFVCMPSKRTDSHQFISSAHAAGASAYLVLSKAGYDAAIKLGPTIWLEPDQYGINKELSRLCSTFYADRLTKLELIGVTGTNGKTSTAWMVWNILQTLGETCGYLGTLGCFGGTSEKLFEKTLNNTTPFPVEMFGCLTEMAGVDVQSIAMEVSSHSLDERRVDGVAFDATVFTNLSQDHLDYHGTLEHYKGAKKRLFTELTKAGKRPSMAINIADSVGEEWATEFAPNCLTFGQANAQLAARVHSMEIDRISLSIVFGDQTEDVTLPMGGEFNVENVQAAISGLLCLGRDFSSVCSAVERIRPVPGRFEPVKNDHGIACIVDYAHTPDGLIKLLDSVRALNPPRIITVFGCGGDRDKTKRPIMARAASERSDVTILTSDNPRTEDPQQILRDAEAGMSPGATYELISDRAEAIARAVQHANPNDVVVVAGKGHENYQIIGTTKFPMDDRNLIRAGLEARN